MDSAFGIDHGEVSKAMPPTVAHTGGRKIAGAFKRIGSANISLNEIGQSAGKGVKGTGSFLEKHPGLTGTALVGGGGAAGYKYLSRKEPKRKKPR